MRRVILIVCDGLGVGSVTGTGPDTLATLTKTNKLHIPNLTRLKIGETKVAPESEETDTVSGHWELTGVVTEESFKTYLRLPDALLETIENQSGVKIVNGGRESGTIILEKYGPQQENEKFVVAYTSADSVLQLAAHQNTVTLTQLYGICKIAARVASEYKIARVIARPYIGDGAYTRTYDRKDFVSECPGETTLDILAKNNLKVYAVGKINDIYAGRSIAKDFHTEGNVDGMETTLNLLDSDANLIMVNLVDFDTLYGHRRDIGGYVEALNTFDRWIPKLEEKLTDDDLVIITGDHGNDPGWEGFNHTREYTPAIIFGPAIAAVEPKTGVFSDIGVSVLKWLKVNQGEKQDNGFVWREHV